MITYIGIGSNLGNRGKNMEEAITLLKEKCGILKSSSIYETEPVGFKDQYWFFNCVVKVDTNLKPIELLDFLQSIEKRLKRVKTIKNGPRTIDLDILFYGDEIINNGRLIVPHPRLHERLFVLIPLKEIAPDLMHPVLKKTILQLDNGKV